MVKTTGHIVCVCKKTKLFSKEDVLFCITTSNKSFNCSASLSIFVLSVWYYCCLFFIFFACFEVQFINIFRWITFYFISKNILPKTWSQSFSPMFTPKNFRFYIYSSLPLSMALLFAVSGTCSQSQSKKY